MNYGEKLAYWYLRLNGFFPITNFVVHGHQAGQNTQSGDIDLLAIRLPYVSEDVGGFPCDWDDRFGEWGIELNHEAVGLIVEVKTGREHANAFRGLKSSFSKKRVAAGIRRLGQVHEDSVEEIMRALRGTINEFLRWSASPLTAFLQSSSQSVATLPNLPGRQLP